MGNKLFDDLVTIGTGIIGLAIIAVLVGGKNTGTVITDAGNAFTSVLGAAVKPATGGV